MGVSAHRRASAYGCRPWRPPSRRRRGPTTPGIPPAVIPGHRSSRDRSGPCRPSRPRSTRPRAGCEAIYDADVAAGGASFWFDRVLERPFLSNQDSYLYTRGRALYMYTHNAAVLGFGGGYAYRERPTGANQACSPSTIPGVTLTETTAERRQYPSHWRSTHTAAG